ncbi:Beta-galactosidase 15-like protein [Drosera capensis]
MNGRWSNPVTAAESATGMWPELIRKAKEGGLDAIETCVFWNVHEPLYRQYDFSGKLDLVRFLKTIQDAGLYAILRIGPYVCAEWNYGGFPVWLHSIPNIRFRTNNTVYEHEMQTFTGKIVYLVKHSKLSASQAYGQGGVQYINWCANMAESMDISVPWIMCQQCNAPDPIINTCNSWYCDQFKPKNDKILKIWTGWFQDWGGPLPYRTAEDVASSIARFFQFSGTVQNYYMLEKALTYADVQNIDYTDLQQVTIFTYNNKSSCFIGNANESEDFTVTVLVNNITVPAWSVSILPGCKTEVYNSAKVNAQTSVMEKKKTEAEQEPYSLQWQWKGTQWACGGFTFEANVQLESGVSATVGLTNYGGNFDTVPVGVLGPVKLTATSSSGVTAKFLSTNQWK